MLYAIAQIFTAAALFAPTLIREDMFFPFITAKAIFLRIVIELALGSFLIHLLLSPNRSAQWKEIRRRLKHPVVIAVSIFALIFIISAFTGVNVTQSFWSNFERGEGAFQMLHYYIFFILAYLLFAEPKALKRLIVTQLIASTYITLYALAQSLLLQKRLGLIGDGYRPSGTLGNPSYISAYLLFNFAFILFLLLRTPSTRKKIVLGVLLAFQFYIFMLSGTRAAFFGLLVAGGIACVINMFTVRSNKVRVSLAAVLAVGLLGTIIIVATHAAPFWKNVPIIARFASFSNLTAELQPRFWTWGQAVTGIIERPILGWGAENFPYPFDKYYDPRHYGLESFFDRTHNVFLEYLITGGIPLFLAYISIFFFYYKTLKVKEKNFWYSVLFVVPIAYLVQGFFLFDVLPIYIAMLLFLAMAINFQHPAEGTSPFTDELYEKRGPGLLISLGVTSLIIVSLTLTAVTPITKNFAIASALQTQGGIPAFQQFEKALQISSPVGQEEAVGNLNRFLLNAIEQTLAAGGKIDTKTLRALVDETNQWYDENASIMPGVKDAYLNGALNIRAGISFNEPDYLARGKKIYADALAFAPTRVEMLVVLLDVARYEKDTTQYQKLITTLHALRPDIDWTAR